MSPFFAGLFLMTSISGMAFENWQIADGIAIIGISGWKDANAYQFVQLRMDVQFVLFCLE